MKTKRNRSKRVFFKLYNFLICMFLLLPLLDMARIWVTNMIDTKIHYDNVQIVDSSGVAVEVYEAPQPSYTLNDLCKYTLNDFSPNENWINNTFAMPWSPNATNFIYNNTYIFTNLDFFSVFRNPSSNNYTFAKMYTFGFVHFYLNWLLDVTLIAFIPYVLLCISQWFMGLTEDLTSRTNKEDY